MEPEASDVQAMGALAADQDEASHFHAMKRLPLVSDASPESSQSTGGTITLGGNRLLCGTDAFAGIICVSAGPPGITTFTVTPVPARSFAMIADRASVAAFEGP
jgi:hypothetical protein